jgi:uncharacterized membrane protein YhaH (DUF805 family)
MTQPALPHRVALNPEGDFMEYMLMPLKRFFDFSGRSRRKEFWLWILLYIIVYVVALVLDVQLGLGGSSQSSSEFGDGAMSASASFNGGILTLGWALIALIPSLAVTVRRLHDVDKSGWFILLGLIPLVGFYLLYLYCQPGTAGPNRFGADPKGGTDAQTFA